MHFDPDQNARKKAAARERHAAKIASGEIDALAPSRQNSMLPIELIRIARIVRDPNRRSRMNAGPIHTRTPIFGPADRGLIPPRDISEGWDGAVCGRQGICPDQA